MRQLPPALAPLAEFRQFLLYKAVPKANGKTQKLPIDPRSLQPYVAGSDWQNDATATTDFEAVSALLAALGPEYGLGFLFKAEDPFFFVDLDNCLMPDRQSWSPVALDILARLPGAAVEVSQSGEGLHIFGRGKPQDHGSKNVPLGLELYTQQRFVALTGTNAIGDANVDCSGALPSLVATYFPQTAGSSVELGEWTEEAVPESTAPDDDDVLIEKMRSVRGAASVFDDKRATFADLWDGNVDVLCAAYPDESRGFDASAADAALAQHLAFWTGKNCERIKRLMLRSGLVRDKYESDYYMQRTILKAVALQGPVYSIPEVDNTLADAHGGAKLNGSPAQRQMAEGVRAIKLAELQTAGDTAGIEVLCKVRSSSFFIDHKDQPAPSLVAMRTPTEKAAEPLGAGKDPVAVEGFQYLAATQQREHFAGCVYVQSLHKIFTPRGALLKADQFNATYGGYSFQMTSSNERDTRKAWEAFTESQVLRWPKAEFTCFRPELPTGALIKEDDSVLVNTYVPANTPRLEGDATPFLNHLIRLLPVESDREILLAYMAACIQHKGVKFQWAPLVQGVEGNGKTLFTRCVAFAVGDRHTHLPPASEISEKFNEWLFGKVFIGIEDVYVPDHKKEVIEVLKPMITNDKLAMRAMQASQVMGDNRANFMLNSNHRDAIRKTRNDRRFCVFYTAQQSAEDISRDGMGGEYFPTLYQWLKSGGYAIVAKYLEGYAIPDALNPATLCHRAPETSSTHAAIAASIGGAEQEILEAIDEGRPGFAGGWVSSVAVDRLLQEQRLTRAIPQNRRRELMQELGFDWHPALVNGRVNNPVAVDGGKKPRLFIREGHHALALVKPADIAKAYETAQTVGGVSVAASTFGKTA